MMFLNKFIGMNEVSKIISGQDDYRVRLLKKFAVCIKNSPETLATSIDQWIE